MAEAHGGSIAVRSGEGTGSEFVLRLPLDITQGAVNDVAATADS
jgi:signal transduction histidine kinase